MQTVLVPTTKLSYLVLTGRSLSNLFSNVFDNLTGWWECMLYKPIYKVYYFIFLGICKALNQFRVEFIDRTLGAIETPLQRCTVDIILLRRAGKIRRKLLARSSMARAIWASVVELSMFNSVSGDREFTKKGVVESRDWSPKVEFF
jgi:hypothetical protein